MLPDGFQVAAAEGKLSHTQISSLFLEIVSLFSARLHQTVGPYIAPAQ